MFKNKGPDGKLNISGKQISQLRISLPGKVSQRMLAERLQLMEIDLDKNAIQQIESGKRFVTDIELAAFAKLFGVPAHELLTSKDKKDPAS